MGISNELFQTERDETASCQFATVPNDVTNFDATTPIEVLGAIERFANFMRSSRRPCPRRHARRRGFDRRRQAVVHQRRLRAVPHPSFTTSKSTTAALSIQPVNLFSDLLVHDMGTGLADGVSQGEAGPREFRSAPLWGLGHGSSSCTTDAPRTY